MSMLKKLLATKKSQKIKLWSSISWKCQRGVYFRKRSNNGNDQWKFFISGSFMVEYNSIKEKLVN